MEEPELRALCAVTDFGITGAGYGLADEERLRQEFARRIGDRATIRIDYPAYLERTAAGKFAYANQPTPADARAALPDAAAEDSPRIYDHRGVVWPRPRRSGLSSTRSHFLLERATKREIP